ncbi:MAG: hypothetical protein R3E53_20325 [Myxococcota bacterium]
MALSGEVDIEQVSFVLGPGWVASFRSGRRLRPDPRPHPRPATHPGRADICSTRWSTP